MMDTTHRLLQFLDESPTCFHAVHNLARRLQSEGFQFLTETEPWTLERGRGYFVTRGDSALIAFRLPQREYRGFLIAAAHGDSPSLKLRETAESASPGGCVRLSVEPYGGGIWRSWLDRPLSVAGRVVVRQDGAPAVRLVNVERDLLVIPSLAIQMDREVNKGGALDPAVDLPPLFSQNRTPGAFRRMIASEAGVEEPDLLSTELFLYPRAKATLLGGAAEFISAPRLDDLQCVFALLEGFLAAQPGGSVPMLTVFNNEEVGSCTRQGADSTFLADVLARIGEVLGRTVEERQIDVARSFLVSADNAHAIHPAHPEFADKQEFPVLGGGIVLKYNANQRYTTDAVSAAVFQAVCAEAGVPCQRYSNRADLPGGSTLGSVCVSHLSVPSVDIGLPQLAMHSCCELAGVRDTDALIRAMSVYFSRSYHPDDGRCLL